jgi:hypothetical protein
MHSMLRRLIQTLFLVCALTQQHTAESGPWGAAAAGGAATSALGGGLSSGTGATTPAATGGGGTSAAPEINNMVYDGMARLSLDIAELSVRRLCKGQTLPEHPLVGERFHGQCKELTPILVEDPTSAAQIGVYQVAHSYFEELTEIHNYLELSFSTQAESDDPNFAKTNTIDFGDQAVEGGFLIRNVSRHNLGRIVLNIGNDAFVPKIQCGEPLPPRGACEVRIDLDRQKLRDAGSEGQRITAILAVEVFDAGDTQLSDPHVTQIIYLTASVPTKKTPAKPAKPGQAEKGQINNQVLKEFVVTPGTDEALGAAAGAVASAPAGSGPSPSAAASTTPPWMTNFGTVATDLASLKSNMSYSTSSVQPTTQTLEILLENELRKRNLDPYTSTSILDAGGAVSDLSSQMARMLLYSSDISAWSSRCNPSPAGAQGSAPAPPVSTTPKPPACSSAATQMGLASALQLMTAYTSFETGTNSSTGNVMVLDIQRGAVLCGTFKCGTKDGGVPSLQVAVAAAGGNTRTNAFFLLNLFYLPKPSYNAGVIVTFELRKADNSLLDSGARTAFYDYNKAWKGQDYDPKTPSAADECTKEGADTYCVPAPTDAAPTR